jgi:RHS repeat-associated protein
MSMGTSLRSYSRGHTLVSMHDGVANATRYYHFDHQGTTQCLTNEAGVVTDRFASDAWGVEVKRTGSSINRHWYVGKQGYYLTGTGVYYARARFVNARIGGWISAEPARIAEGELHFVYVNNRASIKIDPTGLRAGDCVCDRATLEEMWKRVAKKSCSDICKAAREDQWLNQGGAGGVICHWGKKCSCVFSLIDENGDVVVVPGACAELDKCIIEHEKKHEPNVSCDPTCKWSRPLPNKPGTFLKEECDARRAHLKCIEKIDSGYLDSFCLDARSKQYGYLATFIQDCCGPTKTAKCRS